MDGKLTSYSNIIEEIEDKNLLRHSNEDLCKQVDNLQVSWLDEVEDTAYLR
ncbi:hypothetical protein DCAR_0518938 [Daucus carota subsp. sativus]|uniref:Uncharacterized protein n=1 Tax=Daucus carota subsp. sativus TaxID=79200 RepID=A0AAF1B0W0_DAUCS|nr:hypothetical protein DCAR_0518938 [Daucus carota subsp. sativus]